MDEIVPALAMLWEVVLAAPSVLPGLSLAALAWLVLFALALFIVPHGAPPPAAGRSRLDALRGPDLNAERCLALRRHSSAALRWALLGGAAAALGAALVLPEATGSTLAEVRTPLDLLVLAAFGGAAGLGVLLLLWPALLIHLSLDR